MDKESTIDKILEVALKEFAIHGIEGVSSRQIAKIAGVNHACINYYFGGKQEMYLEIIKRANVYFKEKYANLYTQVKEFLKEGNSNAAKAINFIKDILALSRRDILTDCFANFQLLVRREEVFPTEAFELLFKDVFKPHMELMSALVRVAKQEMTENQSLVVANLFMSMNLSQIHCKEGILRLHNKASFDDDLVDTYSNSIDLIIEQILK